MNALPDIKVGTVGYENTGYTNGLQSHENLTHYNQVNSPSEMSDFPTDTNRPTTYGQSRKRHGAGQPS
jgi:hypothetical protein